MKDSHINAYMKDLVMAWQANHDIQYILDEYCCVIYICDYITKAQKGTNTIMAEACKEAKDGNMTLKQGVFHRANKFLYAIEALVVEACSDVLQLAIIHVVMYYSWQ